MIKIKDLVIIRNDKNTRSRVGAAFYTKKKKKKTLVAKTDTVIEYSNNTLEVLGVLTEDTQELLYTVLLYTDHLFYLVMRYVASHYMRKSRLFKTKGDFNFPLLQVN